MFNPKSLKMTLVLLSLILLSAPMAQASDLASQTDSLHHGLQQITGSWFGTTDLGSTFLLSFDNSQTYTVTISLPGVGAGHGHGAWRRTGLATFELTDITLILNPEDGSVALVQKTQVDATVAGDKVTADLRVSIFLPDGTPVDTLTAAATATRIEVEPIP